MTVIYYFSGAGHTKVLADWMADFLNAPVCRLDSNTLSEADTAVIAFPVYCQNIPPPVKKILPAISAKYTVLLATYGGISPGNVLQEAARCIQSTVIAAAAIPTGHSLLFESAAEDYTALSPISDRIHNPQKAEIPRLFKHPFADFFPAWRSRRSVGITCTSACDNCGICETACPQRAICGGRPNHDCIRCLRCVNVCPKGALRISVRPVTKRYLNKKRTGRLYVFYRDMQIKNDKGNL